MADKKVFDFSLLRRLFSFARPYKRSFYWSMVMTVLLAILSPVRPYLIQLTVDKYIANQWIQALITVSIIQVAMLL
ncbi:MAG TPA: ABC transporter ATP-binding protein, partial [Chitinophaga sp.]